MRRLCAALCSIALMAAVFVPSAAAWPGAASPIGGVIVDMATYGPCPIESRQPVPDPSGCWYGHVEGDIAGQIAFWGYEPDRAWVWNETSMAVRFFERFTFLPDAGGWFVGYNDGHWRQWEKFHASGFVTDASPAWEGLVGYRFFEMGVTTCGDTGCTAFGTEMFLAKAKGEAAD